MIRKQGMKRPLVRLPKMETSRVRFGKRLLKQVKRLGRAPGKTSGLVLLAGLLLGANTAPAQSLNDLMTWSIVNGRYVGKYKPGTTTIIAEGTNLYFTEARVRAALSALPPLSYNSTLGQFSFSGLSALGTANQLPGMNAGGTAFEWKSLSGGTIISVSHGAGSLVIGVNTGSITGSEVADETIALSDLGTNSVDSNKVVPGSLALSDMKVGLVSRRFQLTLGAGDSVKVYVQGATSTWTVLAGFVSGQTADGSVWGYCKTDTAVCVAEFGQPVANNKIWAIIGGNQ